MGAERTDWTTNSVGLQAIMNKKILIINPYIGASVNHNSGTVKSSINNVGTVSLTDPILGTASQAVCRGRRRVDQPKQVGFAGIGGN